MARGLEEQLAALSRLRDEPDREQVVRALGKALGNRSSYLVARAARIAGELEIEELAGEMAEAFFRFLKGADKGCNAKTALAEALYQTGAERTDVFLAGIIHVQREPVYGARVDVAAALRGHCAMALVRLGDPDVMTRLAQLLADPEVEARQAAARAIGYSGRHDGVPLLMHKILSGDPDTQVLGECLASMLALADEELALPLLARFLRGDDPEVAEAAALALGESRLKGALAILKDAWQQTFSAQLQSTLLVAMALLRQDEAIAFLLSLIAGEKMRSARAAISALATFRHDESLVEQVRQALQERGDPRLEAAFADAFEVP
jgi:HEAT repeat protein